MKKRMKTKRYADEGLVAEDKKRGLEASKDEKVGFFERLRMGNIDDPKSEAYKRFGAGRGAAERAKTTTPVDTGTSYGMGFPGIGAPVIPKEPESRMPASMPVGLRSAIEGAGVGEGGVAPKVMERETTTVKTPSKTVTQTKKAVAKPSMKYSDKEAAEDLDREMKRASRVPAVSPKTSKEENVGAPGGKLIEKNVRTFRGVDRPDDRALGARLNKSKIPITDNEMLGFLKKQNQERLAKTAANRAASGSTFGKMPGPSLSSDPYSMTLGSDLDPKSMMRRNDRLSGDGDFKKGGKVKPKVKKYASGGMVGKASKRADGIAKKGKTKGRII